MSKESLQLDFINDQFQYKIVPTKVTIEKTMCENFVRNVVFGISKAVIYHNYKKNPLISCIF